MPMEVATIHRSQTFAQLVNARGRDRTGSSVFAHRREYLPTSQPGAQIHRLAGPARSRIESTSEVVAEQLNALVELRPRTMRGLSSIPGRLRCTGRSI